MRVQSHCPLTESESPHGEAHRRIVRVQSHCPQSHCPGLISAPHARSMVGCRGTAAAGLSRAWAGARPRCDSPEKPACPVARVLRAAHRRNVRVQSLGSREACVSSRESPSCGPSAKRACPVPFSSPFPSSTEAIAVFCSGPGAEQAGGVLPESRAKWSSHTPVMGRHAPPRVNHAPGCRRSLTRCRAFAEPVHGKRRGGMPGRLCPVVGQSPSAREEPLCDHRLSAHASRVRMRVACRYR